MAASGRNPFELAHVRPYERAVLSAPGPCVLFASPGALQGGLSLEAFHAWAGDARNLVLFPTHCIKGTLGERLLSGAASVIVPRPRAPPPTAAASSLGLQWDCSGDHDAPPAGGGGGSAVVAGMAWTQPASQWRDHHDDGVGRQASMRADEVSVPVACACKQVSFSAHADAKGNPRRATTRTRCPPTPAHPLLRARPI